MINSNDENLMNVNTTSNIEKLADTCTCSEYKSVVIFYKIDKTF